VNDGGGFEKLEKKAAQKRNSKSQFVAMAKKG